MAGFFILNDDRKAVEVTMQEWMEWFSCAPDAVRVVAQDTFGIFEVSTVFIGIDTHPHSDPDSELLIFETMIFGGNLNGGARRVGTWERALENHRAACDMIRERQFGRRRGN